VAIFKYILGSTILRPGLGKFCARGCSCSAWLMVHPRRTSTSGVKPTSIRGVGCSHTECKLGAIGIDDIKVAHAIVVVLCWLDYLTDIAEILRNVRL
jgi:hypothetical protein